MENLQGLTDSLIPKSKTRLMRLIKREPYVNLGSSTAVFGKRMIINVPREYNNLSQIYIKSTITTSGIANPMPYLGTRIFERITVRTKRGIDLCIQSPVVAMSRLDSSDSALQNQLQNVTTPDVTWANNTMSVITPLFAWFSEPNKSIPTKYIEDLEVELIVAKDFNSMGINDVPLTAATFEVFFKYYDDLEDKAFQPGKVLGYDYYYETPILDADAGSAKLFLTCPSPVTNSHIALLSINQAIYEIQRVLVKSRGSELIDLDRRMCYSLATKTEVNVPDGGCLDLFWGESHDRNKISDYIIFNKSMDPVELTVFYVQPSLTTCYLYVVHEYAQMFEYQANGLVIRHLMNDLDSMKYSDNL
jgi:hypothetical protein